MLPDGSVSAAGVVIGGLDGILYKLALDGSLVWSFTTRGQVPNVLCCRPAVLGSLLPPRRACLSRLPVCGHAQRKRRAIGREGQAPACALLLKRACWAGIRFEELQ